LAEFHGVSKEYLSKALQALAQAGLIEGTLGPTGGYRLARSPKEITFLDITEAVEGTRRTFQCTEIRGNNPCLKKTEKKFSGTCAVAKVMYRADEAWRKELRGATLEDLLDAVAADVPAEQLQRSWDWLRTK
jgi:Rrf2 family protein